jgi:hypothetical protein
LKFYDIDNALKDAITAGDKPLRLKIEINLAGHFESVFEKDIIEANFYGLKETAGGTSSRGDLLLDNQKGIYSYSCVGAGTQVKVYFSLGEGLPYFQRFIFYIDDKGLQDIYGSGRKRFVFISLRDFSYILRKSDEARDWTAPAVFTYSVVCDKTTPEKSLVHGIAKKAGLSVNDIDCSTIPVTLPYVKLRRNIWAELSALAAAYRCHLECAPEKPLVFAHSPYQIEPQQEDEYSYTFFGDNIFYFRIRELSDFYRNTVRLKVNMPVSLSLQEIWNYEDSPVLYDDFLQAHYPFRYPLVREIEAGKYEAKYRISDNEGKTKNVIYADFVDTKEEAENRLDYDGGSFSYSFYDTNTFHDKAIITLQKENDGDLYKACIYGRPIILDINRSCFIRDIEAVENYGTAALNVSGSYFSDYEIDCGNLQITHYEDWVKRELELRLQKRNEYFIKTHRALFNARVGAKVKIKTKNHKTTGTVNSFSFFYKKDSAFIASFHIVD